MAEYDLQTLEPCECRVETGPVQFGDDWPGVFIRGDNALFYGLTLSAAIARLEKVEDMDWMQLSVLRGLRTLLSSCHVSNHRPPTGISQ
jgi:hypothetical protein